MSRWFAFFCLSFYLEVLSICNKSFDLYPGIVAPWGKYVSTKMSLTRGLMLGKVGHSFYSCQSEFEEFWDLGQEERKCTWVPLNSKNDKFYELGEFRIKHEV